MERKRKKNTRFASPLQFTVKLQLSGVAGHSCGGGREHSDASFNVCDSRNFEALNAPIRFYSKLSLDFHPRRTAVLLNSRMPPVFGREFGVAYVTIQG